LSSLLAPADLADAVEPDFYPFNQSQELAFKRFRVHFDASRVQTFHHTTFFAVEVGMGLMVDIWGKAVAK
jgi:hypothetical protein